MRGQTTQGLRVIAILRNIRIMLRIHKMIEITVKPVDPHSREDPVALETTERQHSLGGEFHESIQSYFGIAFEHRRGCCERRDKGRLPAGVLRK